MKEPQWCVLLYNISFESPKMLERTCRYVLLPGIEDKVPVKTWRCEWRLQAEFRCMHIVSLQFVYYKSFNRSRMRSICQLSHTSLILTIPRCRAYHLFFLATLTVVLARRDVFSLFEHLCVQRLTYVTAPTMLSARPHSQMSCTQFWESRRSQITCYCQYGKTEDQWRFYRKLARKSYFPFQIQMRPSPSFY